MHADMLHARRIPRELGRIASVLVAAAISCADPESIGAPQLASIMVSPDSLFVDKGTIRLLEVDARDLNGSPVSNSSAITWTSSDNTTATVDADGRVSGVAVGGPVSISACSGATLCATALVFVTPPQVVVSEPELALVVGGSTDLAATALDESAQPMDVGAPVWESRSTGIARVDQSGRVTAIAPGEAFIDVTVARKTVTSLIHVGEQSPSDGSWSSPVRSIRFEITAGFVTVFAITGFTMQPVVGVPEAIGGSCDHRFESRPFAPVLPDSSVAFRHSSLEAFVSGRFGSAADLAGRVQVNTAELLCVATGEVIRGSYSVVEFDATRGSGTVP